MDSATSAEQPAATMAQRRDSAVPLIPGDFLRLTDRKMHSRLLYTNPVCMLTTVVPAAMRSVESQRWNAMTISWLTATNNDGGLVISINKRRFSADCLIAAGEFCLSVPAAPMQETVLALGKRSGRRGDKFAGVPGLVPCELANNEAVIGASRASTGRVDGRCASSGRDANPYAALETGEDAGNPGAAAVGDSPVGVDPSDGDLPAAQPNGAGGGIPEGDEPDLVAVQGTVARMRCRVVSRSEADEQHWLVIAQIEEAFVHPSYWKANKLFCPVSDDVPPYLTFFGSQTFGLAAPQAPS